jgi:threonine/homoserine/homoserine lactone efflux protein
MTTAELTALLLHSTAASLTPGPDTKPSNALAANFGLSRSLHFVFALPMVWGVLFRLCAAGVGSLAVAVHALRYGIQMLGVVMQFLNIEAWKLALTVMASWLVGRPVSIARFAMMLTMAFGLASNLACALVGSLLREWLAQRGRLQWFNRGMAAILVAMVAWMATL